ncbi:MAG: GNAT family N-acetyltransferase [Robiginitalea sp.]
MIRPAKLTDLPEIMDLTKACAAHLCEQGIYQWNEKYPSREAFVTDLERDELWVLDLGQGPVGTLVLSQYMDEEYKSVRWNSPDINNRYVHRLAVHPIHQGKGFARNLMDFAETKAREEGAASIRLDTFSKNPKNQRFYETRGYRRLSSVYFPKQSIHPFYCYELLLYSSGEPGAQQKKY